VQGAAVSFNDSSHGTICLVKKTPESRMTLGMIFVLLNPVLFGLAGVLLGKAGNQRLALLKIRIALIRDN